MTGPRPDEFVDAWLIRHEPTWRRLADLTARARRSPARLGPGELEELIATYQRVSTHLSHARTHLDDPALTGRLTGLVAEARAVVYGTRRRRLGSVVEAATVTFPAAVWHLRRFVLVSALCTFGPTAVFGFWLANSDRAFEASAPEAVRTAYIEEDFEAYYSADPSAQFATEVFVNNVRVAIFAFAAGILLCVVTAAILAFNGANLGVAAGLFAAVGEQPRFWGLILPHGLLELSAVVVAGAAGLALGWSVIDPGDRPRSVALAEQGRRCLAVVLGLVVAFLVAGLIEGFVTGSALSTPVRVAIGVLAEAAFVGWIVVFGPRAAAAGRTGLGAADGGGIGAGRR